MPRCAKLGDPAQRIMIDLTGAGPRAIGEDCSVDVAQDEMFRWGARALLVRRDVLMVGIVTANDILEHRHACGGRPATHAADRIGDLMTGVEDLPSWNWQAVLKASVKDAIDLLDRTGAKVVIVIDTERSVGRQVRGLFQRSRLDRQARAVALA
jgi:CBS domain-containing protein